MLKRARHRMPPPSPQFCRNHGISLGMLYKLLGQGKGPAIMTAGARKLVSIEAATTWRRQREAETEIAKAAKEDD